MLLQLSGQSWLPCLLNVTSASNSLFSSLPTIYKPDSGWVMRNAEADREGPWGGSDIPQHERLLVLPWGRQLRDGTSALRAGLGWDRWMSKLLHPGSRLC